MSSLNRKQKGLVFGGSAAVLGLAALVIVLLMGQPFSSTTLGQQNATATPLIASQDVSISTPAPDVEKQQQEEMSLITSRLTMLQGTTIGGVDVSNMTKEEATAAVTAALSEQGLGEVKLTLFHENGTLPDIDEDAEAETPEEELTEEEQAQTEQSAPVLFVATEGGVLYTPTAENLLLSVDVDKAVEEAFNLMREAGTYEEFMQEITDIATKGVNIPLSFVCEEEAVKAYVESVAYLVDTPPVNKGYSVDESTHKLTVTECQDGYGIDQSALVEQILNLDPTQATQLTIPMITLTGSDAGQDFVRRSTFSTKVTGTKDRKYNVKKGCEMINGTVLKPDEVFSTNAKLGQRTTKNGWKKANAYVSGTHELQAGGGVCQLSSTLFNAVLYADLEVTDRRNHSMPVGYVDKGCDATINSVGNIIDFKFKNNTEGDIIIICYTDTRSGDLYLTFDIYGLPMSDEFDDIQIKTQKLSTQNPTTEYTEDPTKEEGYEEVTSTGSTGYKYRTYVYYYKDGKVLEDRTITFESTYKMFPKQVTIGTKPVSDSKKDDKTDKDTGKSDDTDSGSTEEGSGVIPAETPAPVTTPKPDPAPDTGSDDLPGGPEE